MKKRILVLIGLLLLIPIYSAQAITSEELNSEVQIFCPDNIGGLISGSGTIIDSRGIILTNRHVVERNYKRTCFIGFFKDINTKPDFGTRENPYLAEVRYMTTDPNLDIALLYITNPIKSFSAIDIWNSNSDLLRFGDKLEAVGFPGIGGAKITYSSGDFSGFGDVSNATQNYLKTTVILEHGNSGGAAYNSNNQYIGMPSMIISGTLNSISYLLSVNAIKKWAASYITPEKQEKPENIIPIIPVIPPTQDNFDPKETITPPPVIIPPVTYTQPSLVQNTRIHEIDFLDNKTKRKIYSYSWDEDIKSGVSGPRFLSNTNIIFKFPSSEKVYYKILTEKQYLKKELITDAKLTTEIDLSKEKLVYGQRYFLFVKPITADGDKLLYNYYNALDFYILPYKANLYILKKSCSTSQDARCPVNAEEYYYKEELSKNTSDKILLELKKALNSNNSKVKSVLNNPDKLDYYFRAFAYGGYPIKDILIDIIYKPVIKQGEGRDWLYSNNINNYKTIINKYKL